MTAFKIDNPLGVSPATPARRSQSAGTARDVDLSNATVMAFNEDLLVSENCKGARNIMVEDCCVQCVDDCDELVRIELPCVTYYKVEDCKLYASCEPCSDDWCEIHIPCDLCAPEVKFLEDRKTQDCTHVRTYAYSLIDKFGNTTPMSRPSEPTIMDWDVETLLTGFDTDHPGCWEKVCIWATQPEDTDPTQLQVGVNFFKVGEIDLVEGVFMHEPPNMPPIEGYNEEKYQRAGNPPPGLHCLQVINRGKQMAGLDKKGDLHFSLPNNLGAFSGDYLMRFRKPGKAFIATESFGYVLTGGMPQVIDLSFDCEGGKCHQSTRIEYHLPIISKRSAAKWMDGVVYASDDGLVYLAGVNPPVLLTKNDYTRAQWLELQPTLMHGAVHDGYYIGVTPTETIRVRLPGNLHDDTAGHAVTTMSIRPTAMYTACDGRLFFADDEGVKEFSGGTDRKPYRWSVGPVETAGTPSLSSLVIRMGCCEDVKLRLLQGDCDQREVFCRVVTGNRPIRLPRYIRAEELYIELEGVAEVNAILIGADQNQLLGL